VAGLNKVILIGNLGRDPEMRYTPSGSPVTNFSMAVSRVWKTPEGENREETDWFNVSCWDRLAETANNYLSKGRQVYIEGRVRGRQYDDRNTGEKRFSLDVHATNLVLLGARGDQGGEALAERVAGPEPSDLDNMPF
jgi:single-strand DNA-binding protein